MGHVLQGFREEEAQDGDEFNTTRTQMHRRSLKRQGIDRTGRHGRKKRSVATTGLWYGSRSRYLYFQALQLVLRMQVAALQREMPGLPEEIEPICRDLWALYVSMREDLAAQPYIELHSTSREGGSAVDQTNETATQRAARIEREEMLSEEWEESEAIRERLEDVGVFEEDNEEDDNRQRRAISSEWESSAQEQGGEDFRSQKRTRGRRRGKKARAEARSEGKVLTRRRRDELIDLLAILHLAMVSIRVPTTWHDLCCLVRAGKLPFLHVIHHLPADMVSPFPAREVRKLDPTRVPSISRLHRQAAMLAADLYTWYGIQFGELNVRPILWRYVERLLLPPTIYTAAKTLLEYVKVPMHTVPDLSDTYVEGSGDARFPMPGADDGPALEACLLMSLGKNSAAREAILMGAIVIVIKMALGLDGEARYELFEDSDSWAGVPSLPSWLASLKRQNEQIREDIRASYDPQSMSVLDMDEAHLDAYLSFAEQYLTLSQQPQAYTWRRRDEVDDLLSCAPELCEKFSLKKQRNDENEEDCGTILMQQNEFVPEILDSLYQDAASDNLPKQEVLSPSQLRPGEAHSIYSDKDNYSQSLLPSDYVQVLQYASSIVGCSQEELASVIRALEVALVKLLVWRRKCREAANRQRQREEQGRRKPGRPWKQT